MSFLENLQKHATIPASIQLQFDLYDKSGDLSLIAFVEGVEDEEYYKPVLREYSVTNKVHFIYCDGKQGVVDAEEWSARERAGFKRALFFVDKDFEDFINRPTSNSRIYVTDFYSIENHLANESALKYVLCELAHIPEDDMRVSLLVDEFLRSRTRFALFLKRCTAFAIILRTTEKKINLNNIRIQKAFHFDTHFQIVSIQNLGEVLSKMTDVDCNSVDSKDITKCCQTLHIRDLSKWLRGKFALWHFLAFIRSMYVHLKGTTVAGGKAFPKAPPVNEENVFKMLAGRVSYPASLQDYFQKMLHQ